MNLIELHILQSFPVTCLNRDDVGAPKTAMFGGCTRARVSSQCWKRAIRSLTKEYNAELFKADRGRFVAEQFAGALKNLDVDETKAWKIGEQLANFLGKKDTKYKKGHRTEVALFFSPGEIAAIAEAAKAQLDESGKVEPKKGSLAKAIKAAQPKDMADVAIFGRMVANDHTLMVEGAGLFSHALSTHAVANEIDFFSAVDETKPEAMEDEGAGHIGTLEFNAACYYRYIGLNLDLLADESHLGHFSPEERSAVIETFLQASLLAVPTARKNSMFGFNPPAYVLGLRREGQPLSLVNAFEKPITAGNSSGYLEPSQQALKDHWASLKSAYSLKATEVHLPEKNIDEFIQILMEGLK